MSNFFPFKIRQAMQVAGAVAEEVINNHSYGRTFGGRREREVRPSLMSYKSQEASGKVTFRYERGVVVTVYLYNMVTLSSPTNIKEDWWVYQVDVKYYRKDSATHDDLPDKVLETWGSTQLESLKEVRNWGNPRVVAKEEITSKIGVFVDRGALTGSVVPDYTTSNIWFSTLYYTITYSVLIPGDRERRIEEAKRVLEEFKNSFKE